MNQSGPIIIIEDDDDDLLLLSEIFRELRIQNKILTFKDGIAAYDYLEINPTQPFLIISDINLPKLNGFELRQKIHNNEQLRLKCIPYLFFTTASNQNMVIEAYSQSVQGFFVKPSSYEGVKRLVHNIVEYWRDCHSPNVT